ncbi:hypothetical protein PI125_g18822 [Phytophthora idaei]|nr:hypothetical protein PI125_g18822 [Phytophthora idaei]KAG3137517.1 hypothetical protein PI126_g17362 [Phytophthora idaei]
MTLLVIVIRPGITRSILIVAIAVATVVIGRAMNSTITTPTTGRRIASRGGITTSRFWNAISTPLLGGSRGVMTRLVSSTR